MHDHSRPDSGSIKGSVDLFKKISLVVAKNNIWSATGGGVNQ